MKKVLIAVPSTFVMWSHVTTSLINMAVTSSSHFELGYVNIQSALLPISRDDLIVYARKMGFDYILFVDSDMLFPPDALLRLMSRDKDIVGVNAAIKGEAELDENGVSRPVIETDVHGEEIFPNPPSISEVEKIGMAFTLIKLDVFNHLHQPFFYIDYSEDGMSHWGEDVSFCLDIRSFGVKIYCDNILSSEIEHLGEKGYKI